MGYNPYVNEPDWSSLSHAYGSADDIPDLLRQLNSDPQANVWNQIWSRVCHQGTTYSVSPYVLPYLLEAAQGWVPSGRVMPLALASSIAASRAFPNASFTETVAGLKKMALQTVEASGISMTDRVYMMSAVLTFSGDRVWGPAIERINDEEFSGICPLCDAELYFEIQENDGFIRNDWEVGQETRQGEIEPREESELPSPGAWLHEVAVRAGDADLALRIRFVFGTANCTSCDGVIEVAAAIERFENSSKSD